MKALSLTQPWASAICIGVKQWETRSWPTKFRGELVIHASKGFPAYAKELTRFAGRDYENLPAAFEMPLGVILCVCELTDCRRTEDVVGELSAVEQSWGDYAPGRYAFKLENVRVLSTPVPARGALGFWAVPWDEAVAVIRATPKAVTP